MKKRIISTSLTLALLAGLVPAMPVFAEEEPQLLPTERAGIEEFSDDAACFTMGNAQSTLDERGRYILTVYRDGNSADEASVEVKTADVSAVYGRDYIIDDDRFSTTVTGTDRTYLEHMGDEDYFEQTEAMYASMREDAEMVDAAQADMSGDESESISDIAEEDRAEEAGTDETEAAADASEDEAERVSDLSAFDDTDVYVPQESEQTAKSPLAALKEAQSGEESRETYESETEPIIPETLGGGFDAAKAMETSSSTTITFEPGETEKQLIFKILEDDESEGQEMINFILSEPVNAAVTEPFTTSIIIEDDEPVEHSEVSFAHSRYTAKDGVATVTLKRKDPLYSYVTAVITSSNNTAIAGRNFDAVKGIVEFLPYRSETSFEIPVTPSKEDTSFTVELSDLKGGEDGKIMSAEIVIPGSGEDGDATLSGASGSGNTRKITINNVEYKVDYSKDQTIGNIYKGDNKQDIIGYYYSPKYFSYGHGTGDGPTEKKNKYDSNKDSGLLMWHHWKCYRKGGEYADLTYDQRKYQSVFLDYQTYSDGTTTSMHGFKTPVKPDGKEEKSANIGGKNSRAIRGPITLWYDVEYMDGKEKEYDKKPSNNSSTYLRAQVYRARSFLYDPDMEFYGAILLNKEYHIEVEKADEQEYKTADGGTRKLRPGKISAMKTTVWREGTVTFENDAALGEKQKWGELVGYDITCGSGPNAKVLRLRPASMNGKFGSDCYYADTNTLSYDRTTLTFTDALAAQIDSHLGSLESSSLGCYAPLSVKPVYEKIPVYVDIFPADDDIGTFDSPYLKESSTNQLFFGDEISLAASPSKGNYISSSYAYKAYETAGTTRAAITSDETNYEENPTMQLCYRKYELKPLFTDIPNHIEISATSEVLRYFNISDTIAGRKTGVDSLNGKTLLITDGKDSYRPIAGKAYRIELTPKPGVTLPEGKRPKIKSIYNTRNYVNGYAMDFIAQAQYKQNRYTIELESYSGRYDYFSIESKALYTSIALLDNTVPLTNEPAKQNYVRGGAWLADVKDKDGNMVKKVESAGTLTEDDGTFALSGVRAIMGDRISVLVSNNNVDRVIYVEAPKEDQTLTKAWGMYTFTYDRVLSSLNREDRTFQELTAPGGESNNYSEVTKKCIIAKINPVEMPVKTAYAPYVRNVFLEYGQRSIGSSTTVAIEENDALVCKARLETNNVAVNCVEFILYKRSGESKGEVQSVYADSEGKINKAAKYTYRTKAPDAQGFCAVSIPSNDLTDGDMLFVRIVSDEKNAAGEYLTYPIINVGIRFYTPIKDEQEQVAVADMSGLGNLPLLGSVASKFDTGKLMYDITYADPDNMGTSAYVRTIGISAIIAKQDSQTPFNAFNSAELNKWKNGVSKAEKKTNEQVVEEHMQNFNPANAVNNMEADMADQYNEEIARLYPDPEHPPTDEQKRETARGLYEKQAYENNLNKLSEKWNITIGAKIMIQLLYAYDYDLEEHVFVGGEYLIASSMNVKKTWYKVIYGVPVFMSIDGTFSAQVDGAWLAPHFDGGTAITAKELRTKQNILNARFRNKSWIPWLQFGANVTWFPVGLGYCGVFDIHGTLKLNIIVRFTFTGEQNKQKDGNESAGGVMIDFAGGIGVSLVALKFEFQVGRVMQGWGVFDTKGPKLTGPKLLEEERDETGFITKVSALDTGDEKKGVSEAELMSVLRQKGDPITVRENTMEKISPQAVQINDEGDLFVTYISGDNSKESVNAPTLKYMIRDGKTGEYTDPIPVDDNAAADGSPAVLFVPSGATGNNGGAKVYVAWTSSADPLDSLKSDEDLDTTKKNLEKLDLFMKVYDVPDEDWENTVRVTNDAFEDTNVQLAWEGGAAAVYYFKRSLGDVNEMDDVLSLTSNYNTWARKVYDRGRKYNTDADGFVYLGEYEEDNEALGVKKGDGYTEELITFKHPTLTDPLVADLSTESYLYWYDDSSCIDYSFYAYSIDADGDLDTSADREIWLQIRNVTDDKTYFPIKLDSLKSDVSTPKLTKLNDDLLITWLSDSSFFNLISVKDVLDDLRNELPMGAGSEVSAPTMENSSLGVFREMSAADAAKPDWYKSAAQRAVNKVNNTEGLSANIANGEFPIVTKDFGENDLDSASRHERALGDYKLVRGNDNNLYLFWVQPSDDPNKLGKALYASAYFRRDDVNDDNETGYISNGFSDPVSISDSGLMIDEISAVVSGDSSALILANTYEQTFVPSTDYTVNPYRNGPHSLTEYRFEPESSLEIEDNRIVMSKVNEDGTEAEEEYPKAGEKIRFSYTVKNTGLLPTKGDRERIEVYNGDSLLFSEEAAHTGDANTIYAGDAYIFTTDGTWTVGEGIDMNSVRVVAAVSELDGGGGTLGEESSVTRPLQRKAAVESGTVGYKSYYSLMDEVTQKVNEYCAENDLGSGNYDLDTIDSLPDEDRLTFSLLFIAIVMDDYPELVEAATAATDAGKSMNDMFDYMIYVPVRNIGNETANITAGITYVTDELDDTDTILGRKNEAAEILPAEPDSTDVTRIAIPIKVNKDQFDRYGIVRGKINLYNGEEKLTDGIDLFIAESGNINFSLEGEGETLELYRGEEKALTTEAYPFDKRKSMVYSSSDMDVVTVSEDGVLIATGEGKAMISATETETNRSRTINVEVTELLESTPTPAPRHSSSQVGAIVGGRSDDSSLYNTPAPTAAPGETEEPDGTAAPSETPQPASSSERFIDVPADSWYHEPVYTAFDNGLMRGVSENEFAPEGNVTRAMLVTTLYRLEGEPAQNGSSGFEDVDYGAYYGSAVAWAAGNGIVLGYDDTHFGPDDNVTREQMAAMLYRYAAYKGHDLSAGENTSILGFGDAGSVSEYAAAPLQWTCGEGIINGFEDNTLRPQSNATRAQTAAIMNKTAELFR